MRPSVILLALFFAAPVLAAQPDLLVADFEGPDYGDWKVTGDAFGPKPAHGTLPNQMQVSGFEGRGLVNSYYQGDRTTGTLTSPPFKIERPYLNFLLGGGMHPGKTCINLLVDGQPARTATGPNDKPGGTERLDWHSWDVGEMIGKSAVIEIVDQATGGWGHINIDHIVQSDRRSGVVETIRDLAIDRDYLSFCFAPGQGGRTQIRLQVDGKPVRQAVGQGRPQPSRLSWDVSQLKGQRAQLRIAELPAADGSCPLGESVTLADQPQGVLIVVDKLYQETYRPQFHFTPAKNWTNDPNGLVYYAGQYHLFFQHNPTGINWGNMTWGHAVSPDLVHWRQLDHAIHPDNLGTIFSGSAVVDHDNTAGFQTGNEKPIVCIYTSAGKPFTQSLAYSNDGGRTWTKYERNPVLKHVVASNRDPKVIWHEPTKKWIMALFLDQNDYALFGSPNLKEWTRLCDVPLPGSGECPDFFPIAVDGDPQQVKWLFWGANGNYRLGAFDGVTFQPETDSIKSLWGGNDYAAQTYSDIPEADGRRIQISWMAGGKYPDMPFNQQMNFPVELTLRTTEEGVRLCANPVREVSRLHGKSFALERIMLTDGANPLAGKRGELLHIQAVLEPGDAQQVVLDLRGAQIVYDAAAQTLSCRDKQAPLPAVDGCVQLEILVDRLSIEIFGNGGRIYMPMGMVLDVDNTSLGITAQGGTATIRSLTVHEMQSAWRR